MLRRHLGYSVGIVGCGLILLALLGFLLNPQWLEQTVYATDLGSDLLIDPEAVDSLEEYSPSLQAASPNATVGMTITTDAGVSIPDGGNLKTDVTTGAVSYIGSNIAVTVKDIKSFSVTVEAAENSSSKLIGVDHKQEINVVGSNIKPVNFGDNTWGSTLTAVTRGATSVDNTGLSYSTLPAYNTTPIQQSSAQNLADGTYNLKLVFAAKINADKPADSYGTTARVSVVAIPKELIEYRITYNSNGGTGAVAAQTASTTTESKEFTVAAKGNLAKAGYDFLGWAESPSATTAQYIAGSSKITLTKASPTKTLYAVWKKIITPTTPVTNWNDLTYMQQMTTEACNSVGTPAAKTSDGKINTDVPTKQLIDSRDGKTYWVAKLADGNCWMTQNLDLDLYDSAKGENRTLTPEDSNVSENWPSADKPGTGPSTKEGYHGSSSGYYKAQYYDPASDKDSNGKEIGERYCRDSSTEACNLTESANNGHDAQGNYYSWTAAIAGADTSSVTSGDVSSSICPKGWKLPTSANYETAKKSFGGLMKAYNIISNSAGSSTLQADPLYFTPSGYVYKGSFYDDGSFGYYWSSTAYDRYSAYSLFFSGIGAYPSIDYGRYYGFSVRCVVRQ